MLSSAAEIDISFESSRNSGWHRLGSYPIRFIFHPKTRGKRNIKNFTYPVFCVFNGENWNGLDSNPAYVTHRFESFSEIYRSPLYMKAFASNKVTTKHLENGTLWVFTNIYSFHLQRRSIYHWKALKQAGAISEVAVQSVPFSTVKHVENGT